MTQLQRTKRPAGDQKQPSVKKGRLGSKAKQDPLPEPELDSCSSEEGLKKENQYFLSAKEVFLELEILRKEDFRIKEEQMEKEIQEELSKLQKEESEVDSAEYRKLFDDYGIMMQPEPSRQPLRV